ncbi:MAG: hypothetical protein Q8O90_02030 [Elusimicrobiota bacterium]|nr:hypothetical protein [Elusimicrobiota bacterium]
MGIADKFNLLQALLWFTMGLFIFAACATHFAPRYHRLIRLTAVLFLLLGFSALAEFMVAAISVPAWLLVWKTVNVAALLLCVARLFWEHKRGRRD